jgi:Tol biopolymer transport system component
VAFTRWQGETGSVWLTDVDGTNERQILDFTKQAKGPSWSPDGTQIVINYQQGGRLEQQSVCEDLGGGVFPPGNASHVRFSINDDGEPQLCWRIPPDLFWNLRVIDVADGQFKDLDGGTYAFRPAWDPARPWRIVSDGGRGLLEVDLNRDFQQSITDNVNDGSPVFSPDGRFIAVTAGPQGGGGQGHNIYRLNADGSGRVRLTQTPLWIGVQPEKQQQWNNVAPVWSPDASQIAFLTDRTGRWEIWLMNIDGSNQHPMFPEEINNQLDITYDFVDEQVLSWR